MFTKGLGLQAIYGVKENHKEELNQLSLGEMIIEEESADGGMGETAMKRRKQLEREGIVGAMKALKEELGGDKEFADVLWSAIEYVVFPLPFPSFLFTTIGNVNRCL